MTGRAAGFISASLCAIGCCVPVPPAAAAPDDAPMTVRAAGPAVPAPAGPTFGLGRSVNIESWFRWNDDISTWDQFMSDAAIQRLADLGFGTVRLAVSPRYLMKHHGGVRMARWGYVDRAVARFNRAGLTVVVDLHTEDPLRTRYAEQAGFRSRYTAFVGSIAALVGRHDPCTVALSPLQEPYDPRGRWSGWQRVLHAAARSAAPATTLVATGDDYGSIRGLLDTDYIDDPNLIWDVHLYDPFTFTHQGVPFMGYPFRAFRRVPFPSTPRNVRPSIRESEAVAPDQWKERVRADLRRYGSERWRRKTFEHSLHRLVRWSGQHDGATVWIGEFGAGTDAPRGAAYHWWRVARSEAERAGVRWSAWFWWDYAHVYGGGDYDRGLARALGLGEGG
jgi:endoglucanase